MKLHIDAFALGAHDYLHEKRGGTNIFDTGANENILPSFQGQRNWRYVQTPEGLRLSDGDKVYSFGVGELGDEVSRVPKLDDIPILDFENNKTSGGTAQVHRASPDSIYLTLADGRANPTFRLEHEEGKNWKYIPSKKMIARLQQLRSHGDQKGPEHVSTPKVDLDSLMQGGVDGVKTAGVGSFLFGDGLSSVANPQARGLATDMALYSNPFTGVATGLYDTGSHLMNGRFLSALGSAGMGALSFVPGAGSIARGAMRVGGAGLKALGSAGAREGAKLLTRTAGKQEARALGTALDGAVKGVGKNINEVAGPGIARVQQGANNFAQAGKNLVNQANENISGRLQQMLPPKYNKWEHGFQNPVINSEGKFGLRSPLGQNFNFGTNLRSGADMIAKKPLVATEFLHSYGVGAEPAEDMFKRSSFDGFFGSASGAANAINSGIEGVKNVVGGGLEAAAKNPGTTALLAVGGGVGINKLREAVNRKHREKMENNPEKRFNREVAVPLLGGLGLSALGNSVM